MTEDTPSRPSEPATSAGGPEASSTFAIRGVRGLFVVALVVVVIAGARVASDLVAQTLLGLMLAVAATPVASAFHRRGWPNAVGATLASGLLLVVTGAFGVLLTFAGSELAKELPKFQSAFGEVRAQLESMLLQYDLEPLVSVVNQTFDPSQFKVLPRLLGAASSVGRVGFVLLVAIFAVVEAPTFGQKWERVTTRDPESRQDARRVLGDVQRFLLVKTGTSAVTGLTVGVLTASLGLPAAVLWGLIAFALNFIPFLGSLLAGIPPTFLALLTIDVLTGFLVAAGFVGTNVLIGNVVEPRIMGRTMGLSPLVVLLSVATWGWVLGPIGALLSVPLTVIVKLVLERSERYAWVATLLDTPARFRS